MTFTFEELQVIINNNQLEKLVRSKECEQIYTEHMKQVRLKYGNVENYLNATLFRQDCAQIGHEIVLRQNDFPYDLPDGVYHYLLWSNCKGSGTPTTLSREFIESYLTISFPSTHYQTLFFVNPAALQSIPGIFHAHILLRHQRNQ
jgi:hypothetical protein